MTPYQKAGFNELSLFTHDAPQNENNELNDTILHLDEDDGSSMPIFASTRGSSWFIGISKVEELPKDQDGYYLWDGGECPVPGDWEVAVKINGEGAGGAPASQWVWREGLPQFARTSAFKPISRPDMPRGKFRPSAERLKEIAEKGAELLLNSDPEAEENERIQKEVLSGVHFVPNPDSALATQEGGDHYKKLKIQPMEYSMANGLDACQHTIIKYVTRFRDKDGIKDLRKARHCIDMLIEFETKPTKEQHP